MTPDTPSTEALTPGTKVTNQHPDILHGEVIDLRQSSALPGFVWVRWENGSVELEQVEDLTLATERAVRQEAADTSGLREHDAHAHADGSECLRHHVPIDHRVPRT